jgi:hypothetical protein
METLCRCGISGLGSIAARPGGRRQPDQTVRRRAKVKAPREELIMTSKLSFQLVGTDLPNRYLICLVDGNQIAALARSEGLTKPISLEPIAVLYDEGSGELVPVDGFDDTTPQGRIVLRIMADVYSDALDRIMAREVERDAA